MDDDEKGKQFLQLIDKQNTIQLQIIHNLSLLIRTNWSDEELKTKLQMLISDNYSIFSQLNDLDS